MGAFDSTTAAEAYLDLSKGYATVDRLKAETEYQKQHAKLAEQQTNALYTKQQVDANSRRAAQALTLAEQAPDPQAEQNAKAERDADDPIARSIRESDSAINFYNNLSKKIRQEGGDQDDAAKADVQANHARANKFHYQNLQWEKGKNDAKSLASAAGAALDASREAIASGNDPNAHVAASVAQIDKLLPNWSKKVPLNRAQSPYGDAGPVVDGPLTRAALRQVQMQGVSAGDQIKAEQAEADLLHKKAVLAQEQIKQTNLEVERDRDESFRRDDLSRKNKLADSTIEKNKAAVAKTTGKDAVYKEPQAKRVDDDAAAIKAKPDYAGLSEVDARSAARDRHRLIFDLKQKAKKEGKSVEEYDNEDAEAEADDIIAERIKPGKEGEPGWKLPLIGQTDIGRGPRGRPTYDKTRAGIEYAPAKKGEAATTPAAASAAPAGDSGANITATPPEDDDKVSRQAKSAAAVKVRPGETKHFESLPDATGLMEGTVASNGAGESMIVKGGKWVKK